MQLEKIYNKIQQNKTDDILDYLDVSVFNNDWLNHDFYQEKIELLPKGDYFISDLDGTFYRGFLIEFAITLFISFVRKIDITKLDLPMYQRFLEDIVFFYKIKRSAHNKQISYNLYVECGLYIILKYAKLVNWENFLSYLKEKLYLQVRVNPYLFSINKLLEVIDEGKIFLFVSGASHFIFEIYLSILKDYLKDNYGKKYESKVYGFSSYTDPFKEVLNLFAFEHKYNFIKELKKLGKIENIVGGMGDTYSDFGIAKNIDKGGDFYFINPDSNVINNFGEFKKLNINYHFISARKNLTFEFDIDNIKIL